MHSKAFLRTSVIALAVAFSGSAQALTVTPAYEYQSAGQLTDSRPFTLGFSFTLASSKTVNALGYNTVGFAANQQIGIWDAGNNLVGQVNVSTSDTVIGHFAWAAVSNLTLAAGTYTIGGTYTGGPFASFATGVVNAPGYTWNRDLQTFGSGLNQPTSTTGGYGVNGIPQVNLSFGEAIPEPATWALMIGGFGLVGAAARRRVTAVKYA